MSKLEQTNYKTNYALARCIHRQNWRWCFTFKTI